MKIHFLAFTLLLLSSSISFAQDAVVAEVNGKKITEEVLNTEISRQVDLSTAKLSEDQINTYKRRMVENLVNRELLVQDAEKMGVKVTDEELSEKVEQIKARIPNFEEWKTQNKFTDETLSASIKKDVLITKHLTDEIQKGLSISDQEMQKYFEENRASFDKPEQVKARHILVKVGSEASEEEIAEAKNKINDIKSKTAKQDFAEVAKAHSEGPSGPRGGDLGYFTFNQMVPPFAEAAFNTEPGQISDVVKTRFGYHIIKVEDKKKAEKANFEDVKENVIEELRKKKSAELVEKKIEKLNEDSSVVIYIQ